MSTTLSVIRTSVFLYTLDGALNTCNHPPATPTVLSLPKTTIRYYGVVVSNLTLPPTSVMLLASAKLYASPH